MSKLTERQKRFADEYIICGVAETAALKAGYSEKYSRAQAHTLLANVGIKEYMDERNKSIESAKIADMEEVKEFWTNTLRDDQNDYKDRLKASEFIAKTNGAFIDKQEVKQSGELTVNNPFKDLTTEDLRKLARRK